MHSLKAVCLCIYFRSSKWILKKRITWINKSNLAGHVANSRNLTKRNRHSFLLKITHIAIVNSVHQTYYFLNILWWLFQKVRFKWGPNPLSSKMVRVISRIYHSVKSPRRRGWNALQFTSTQEESAFSLQEILLFKPWCLPSPGLWF